MRTDLPSGTAAELSVPAGPPTRGLVIIPDIAGLRPLFDDLAARLSAELHWAVAVFDPFAGREFGDIDERFAAVSTLDDDRVIGDAEACADLLTERTHVARVALMGFCMGGMYAYKGATSGRFDRAVTFYGMIKVPLMWRGADQKEPLAKLAERRGCPILSIIAGNDPYTPPQDVAELKQFGPLITAVMFPDADHGFVHDPGRPTHRAEDAAEAWRQVYAFLA